MLITTRKEKRLNFDQTMDTEKTHHSTGELVFSELFVEKMQRDIESAQCSDVSRATINLFNVLILSEDILFEYMSH